MNSYKLYTYFRSSASWRVRIVMNLKEIPYEPVFINLLKGANNEPEYTQKLPALLTEKGIIIESLPIIEYLEEIHCQIPLLPKCPFEKAIVRGICEIINSGIQPYHNLPLLKKLDELKVDRNTWTSFFVTKGIDALEEVLKKHSGKYCFQDSITIADVFFMPQVESAIQRFGIKLEDYSHISKVYKNLKNNEAFIKAEPENQPDFPKQQLNLMDTKAKPWLQKENKENLLKYLEIKNLKDDNKLEKVY